MPVRASLGTLTVDLIAQVAGFVTGLDQAAREAEARSKRIEGAFKSAFIGIQGAIGALGIYTTIRKVIDATAQQQTAMVALETTLRATAGASGKTMTELVGLANQIAKTTVYTDEAALSAEKLLLGFGNIKGDVFNEALDAATNLASYMQADLTTAARIVGQAFQNPIAAIGRLRYARISLAAADVANIKRLQEEGNLLAAQNALYEALNKTIKGAAEAQAGTLAGAMTQVANAFNELYEAQSKGSLSEAVNSLRFLKEVLTDPKLVASAQALTAAIIRGFGGAAYVVGKLIEGFVWIGDHTGDFLSDVVVGMNSQTSQAQSDFKALQDAIKTAGDELARLREIQAHPTRGSASGIDEKIATQTRIVVGLEAELNQLMQTRQEFRNAEIAFLEKEIRDREQILRYAGENPTYAGLREEVRLLRQKLELVRAIPLANVAPSGLPTYGGTVTAAPFGGGYGEGEEGPTPEESEQLIELYNRTNKALVEQIALVGKVTEVEKMRIKTTVGEYRLMSETEKQQLLKDAAELDVALSKEKAKSFVAALDPIEAYRQKLIEATRYVEQGTISEKRFGEAADAARKALNSEGDSLTQSLDPLAKYRAEMEKLTKLYERGVGMGGISPETFRRAAEQALKELQAPSQQILESVRPLEAYRQKLIDLAQARARPGSKLTDADYLLAIKQQTDALQEHGRQLTAQVNPLETYRAELIAAAHDMEVGSLKWEDYLKNLKLYQDELAGSTEKLADKFGEKWSTFVDQAKRNMQDLMSGMMTKWLDDFDEGSNNLLVHLSRLLLDIAAQIATAHFLDLLFKPAEAQEATGFWGWLKKILSSFGGSSTAAPPPGGFAYTPELYQEYIGRQSGGPMAPGGIYRLGEGGPELAVAPAGGYVIPHGAALGLGGGDVTVNVVNPPTQPQVTQTRDANGRRQIQILFEQFWQSSMADGKFDAGLRNRFGLRPALGGGR